MKKAATGIRGFDDIALGGLPAGRTTLVQGGAGAGKTIFALETLVHGARDFGEPGIFVCFEEDPTHLRENAQAFHWGLDGIAEKDLHFFEARPDRDMIRSGDVDISGLLAVLQALVKQMGAKRIVFDALDMLLAEMANPDVIRREVHRLNDWLHEMGLTAIITSKVYVTDSSPWGHPPMDFIEFMVDCSIMLRNEIVNGASQRHVRISKYRGSAFQENETPFVVGAQGIDVAFIHGSSKAVILESAERMSTGHPDLDDMLEGGYFRGASILFTGYPGTAKTTFCATFIAAACLRGEKSLFISFVSREDEIVRNLQSVSIDLKPHIDSGMLRMVSARALRGSGETHMLTIRTLAHEHGATCIVTDPLSALSKSGNRGSAPGVAERLIDWAKSEGITVICTSRLDDADQLDEARPLQISTIADTWIHLSYDLHAGERNRRLSIIKARGTGHSNQVQEFALTDAGVKFKDVDTSAGGDMLVGSQRGPRERSADVVMREREAADAREAARMNGEIAQLEGGIAVLNAQLEARRLEAKAITERTAEQEGDTEQERDPVRDLRGD